MQLTSILSLKMRTKFLSVEMRNLSTELGNLGVKKDKYMANV